VVALRLSRRRPRSVVCVVNDYGVKFAGEDPFEQDEATWRELLDTEGLVEDLLEAGNATEFARRGFRSIARIAGLIQQGFPGSRRSGGQLQASSEMFFEVFQEYDPGNLLLHQANREVLENQLEYARIEEALVRIAGGPLELRATERVSPLAFPLYAESIRASTVSSEQWSDRVRRLALANQEAVNG
ncbi:MAG: DNA ligase-associated DEXH box helicase, partial [Planctomycetota bacterium]|nr:DNA ligase-associated DEXH box helicase [Planctomycetota bacterium]